MDFSWWGKKQVWLSLEAMLDWNPSMYNIGNHSKAWRGYNLCEDGELHCWQLQALVLTERKMRKTGRKWTAVGHLPQPVGWGLFLGKSDFQLHERCSRSCTRFAVLDCKIWTQILFPFRTIKLFGVSANLKVYPFSGVPDIRAACAVCKDQMFWCKWMIISADTLNKSYKYR